MFATRYHYLAIPRKDMGVATQVGKGQFQIQGRERQFKGIPQDGMDRSGCWHTKSPGLLKEKMSEMFISQWEGTCKPKGNPGCQGLLAVWRVMMFSAIS